MTDNLIGLSMKCHYGNSTRDKFHIIIVWKHVIYNVEYVHVITSIYGLFNDICLYFAVNVFICHLYSYLS